VLVTVIVAIVVLAVLSESGLFVWRQPIQVYMTLSEGGSSTLIANIWQDWTIHMKDGSIVRKGNQNSPIPILSESGNSVSGEPAWIDVVSSVQLEYQLRSVDCWVGLSNNPCLYASDNPNPGYGYYWSESLVIDPTMAVISDSWTTDPSKATRVADSIGLDQFGALSFDTTSKIGDIKTWTMRIIFSGSAPSTYPTVDFNGALSGKSNANIQVVWSENFFQFKYWQFVNGYDTPKYCPNLYPPNSYSMLPAGTTPSCTNLIDHKAGQNPYSLGFPWSQGVCIGGCSTVIFPTNVISTDNSGNVIIIYTATGTQFQTIWVGSNTTVVATIFGPEKTKTVTIGTNPYGNYTPTGPGNGGDWCSKTDIISKFICWVYGSTCLYNTPTVLGASVCALSVPNYWFVIAALLVVAILLLRRGSSPSMIVVGGGL